MCIFEDKVRRAEEQGLGSEKPRWTQSPISMGSQRSCRKQAQCFQFPHSCLASFCVCEQIPVICFPARNAAPKPRENYAENVQSSASTCLHTEPASPLLKAVHVCFHGRTFLRTETGCIFFCLIEKHAANRLRDRCF